MTIASEIQRIKTNIANAYTNAESKGATLPEVQNSDNLATCINSISGGGIQYTGNLNFIPVGDCEIDENGIRTKGGFVLDCAYDTDALNRGDMGSYLNFFMGSWASIAPRVRFKPAELNKKQTITGTRTNTSDVGSDYSRFGLSFTLMEDNTTIKVNTNETSTTLIGTLLTPATTTEFTDIFVTGWYSGGWKAQMFQTTDLMQTWTAISSVIDLEIGGNTQNVFGKRFSEFAIGEGYFKGYKFNFNGEIDTKNSGILSPTYDVSGVYVSFPVAQDSPVIMLKDPANITFSIVNGIASGFSANPVALITCTKPFIASFCDSWERGVKITTGADVTTEQCVLGATSSGQGYGLSVKNGKLQHTLSSTADGINTITANTDYFIKTVCEYSNSTYTYTTSISADGTSWTQDYTTSAASPITSQNIVIGLNGTANPFLGEIDLTETYWSINGVEEWRGANV